jgi:hypothetical protein
MPQTRIRRGRSRRVGLVNDSSLRRTVDPDTKEQIMATPVLRCARLGAATLALTLLSQVGFAAGVAIETNGFENFALGNLQPQQGWQELGPGAGTAVVQEAVAEFGTKSLKVDRAAGVDTRWAVPLASAFPGRTFPASRFMLVSWDMSVVETGATTGAFGPFFGMEGFDDQGVFGLLGSFGVDATTRDVIYQRQVDGAFVETGSLVESGEWNSFAVAFDFDMNRYTVFLNGQALATTGFVDGGASGTALDQLTDADISALAAGGDTLSQNITGTAYYDNFRVLDGIPGDNDIDGDVDNQDLVVWQNAYGVTGLGDADGDADTDGNDFLIWQRNVGADFTPVVGSVSAVPEPVTVGLASVAILGAMHLARRRRILA